MKAIEQTTFTWYSLLCCTRWFNITLSLMMKSNSQCVTIPLKAIYHTCAITYFSSLLVRWRKYHNLLPLELCVFVISPPTYIPLQQSPECQTHQWNRSKIIRIKTRENQINLKLIMSRNLRCERATPEKYPPKVLTILIKLDKIHRAKTRSKYSPHVPKQLGW